MATSESTPNDERLDRYAKQIRFAPIGEEGQRRLLDATVLVAGCGALGSVVANTLARAGVGSLRIVDRDFLEVSNLQRQVLFQEQDVADGLPKAVAAAHRLRAINSTLTIEPKVEDLTYHNLQELAEGVDLIVDGTDNFETRLLLNDYALKQGIPWIFGGVLGAEGQVMPIVPGRTACLACLVPSPPRPGDAPTCDQFGVLGPAVNVIASIEATEAIKILAGCSDALSEGLTVVDLWRGRSRRLAVPTTDGCRACQQKDYAWLDGRLVVEAVYLCGRSAVQLSPPEGSGPIDLPAMRAQLARHGEVQGNPFLLQFVFEGHEITLFADGRAIIGGVEDVRSARTVWSRCLGG